MSGRLFPHTCSVSRNSAVGTNGRKAPGLILEAVRCNFIPMSSRHEMESGFTVGSAYDVYFPSHLVDVKTGDRLVWEGQSFNVRTAHPYVAGRLSHKHALVTREGV